MTLLLCSHAPKIDYSAHRMDALCVYHIFHTREPPSCVAALASYDSTTFGQGGALVTPLFLTG